MWRTTGTSLFMIDSRLQASALVALLAAGGIHGANIAEPKAIVGQWNDADGNRVVLREGNWNGKVGFGFAKIRAKHGIHEIGSVRFVTTNPAGGEQEGTRRVYLAYANRQECNSGICRYVESVPVRAVVEFSFASVYYGVKLDDVVGVLTTYCLNEDKAHDCPPWVDAALARPAPGLGDVLGTVLSYLPLSPGPGRPR